MKTLIVKNAANNGMRIQRDTDTVDKWKITALPPDEK